MKEDTRYMWLLVFFDLPTKTRNDRKDATNFRNHLLKGGFIMIQYSIYGRICRGTRKTETHLRRMKGHLPPKGCVRALIITEIQYSKIKILVEAKERSKNEIKAEQLLLF